MKWTKVLLIFTLGTLGILFLSFRGEKYTEISLGKDLFFEKALSSDYSISCASCHKPEFAFADTMAFSNGVNGAITKRNTPSVMNMASREFLFWDGRANTLEQQALGPITSPHEMNMDIHVAIQRLKNNPYYVKKFKKVYKSEITEKYLLRAIASYERSLETSSTANDRWIADMPNGLTEQQIRGREIFFNKGKCIECHFTPDFTGDEFRNIGLFDGNKWNDSGRYLITKKIEDIGKFKVPGLRNVAVTAPYMHDGSMKTLRDVIDFYNTPEKFINTRSENLDTLLQKPLGLDENEIQDLISFLHGLTDDRFLKK